MDTSFWTQFNHNITVGHTVKKYYNKYFYRLTVYAPAGRLIYEKGSITDALQARRDRSEFRKQLYHWSYFSSREQLDKVDITFLAALKDLHQSKTVDLRMRVEEPRIQIYAATNEDLMSLVNNELAHFPRSYFESITVPESEEALTLLDAGSIIKKSSNGFRYKVVLRDGHYNYDTKSIVLQYLLNLGPTEANIPKSTFDLLSNHDGYVWNLYFYLNDVKVLSFLELMAPGMILKSHELVVLPHKY